MGWDEVEERLAATLRGLAEGTSAVADAAPAREAVTRRRRLGGLVGERRGMVRAYVQWLRIDDTLHCECVGGPQVGGTFPWSDAEHAALLALGWSAPVHARVPTYTRVWTGSDAGDDVLTLAAQLAVRTFRDVLGSAEPDGVTVQVNT
ncbi:hypothetical protein GXB85_06135 [Cellulomonas sp. APG4]|uniref:TY-Chap domain-containing protein n=1 Tax=Cellulomonas sp. APG4 TaxID=1538656 RepID=UPI00137B47D9|nr:hypothetical protein [Cellulomonas sp. APG4]NCT90523.1 hypothetical protein [Cellulomonas sp. APG4]